MVPNPKAETTADEDPAELLSAARAKAERLLDQLIAEQAEMEQSAAAEGRQAIARAVLAARRALAALDAAAAVNRQSRP